jgi:hypothetical protein
MRPLRVWASSPRVWAGVAVGAAAYWLWQRRLARENAFVGAGPITPRPIRRVSRRLRNVGWPTGIGYRGTPGSTR